MGACSQCGTDAPPKAQFCPSCGTPLGQAAVLGGGGWAPLAGGGATTTPAISAPKRRDNVVTGRARDVHTRNDTDWFTKSSYAVLGLRVETFDDHGNLTGIVPVELRGSAFQGFVVEGDEVRVIGRVKRGTLRAARIDNLTSNAQVTADKLPILGKVIAVILLVAIAAFIAYGFSQLVTGG